MGGRSTKSPVLCVVVFVLTLVLARPVGAWERGNRITTSERVIDLRFMPPVPGMTPSLFITALYDENGFLANRVWEYPASVDHGTLLFTPGAHSSRIQAQADACMMACAKFNELANTRETPRWTCDGVTVMPYLARQRLFVDNIGENLLPGFTCAPPIAERASCFMLSGTSSSTAQELTLHTQCMLSTEAGPGAHHAAPSCGQGRWSAWVPGWSPNGSPTAEGVHSLTNTPPYAMPNGVHGGGCVCPPGLTGSRCEYPSHVNCVRPVFEDVVSGHCPLAFAEADGWRHASCVPAMERVACRVCRNHARKGALCTEDKCTFADGSSRCGTHALGCEEGLCVCPRGRDPSRGCDECLDGYTTRWITNTDRQEVCVPMEGCWMTRSRLGVEDRDAQFGTSRRAVLCGGKGVCMDTYQLLQWNTTARLGAPPTGTCVCDEDRAGRTCDVRIPSCSLASGTGTCRETQARSLDTLQPGDGFEEFYEWQVAQCTEDGSGATHHEVGFYITDAFPEDMARSMCSRMGGTLEQWDDPWPVPGDITSWIYDTENIVQPLAHMRWASNTYLGTKLTRLAAERWHSRSRGVSYGLRMAQGWPVACRGALCTPDTSVMVRWMHLIPIEDMLPTEDQSRGACLGHGLELATSADTWEALERMITPRAVMHAPFTFIPATVVTYRAYGIVWFDDVDGTGAYSWVRAMWEREQPSVLIGLATNGASPSASRTHAFPIITAQSTSDVASLPGAYVRGGPETAWEQERHYIMCTELALLTTSQPYAPLHPDGAAMFLRVELDS